MDYLFANLVSIFFTSIPISPHRNMAYITWVLFTIKQHWFGYWLGAKQAYVHQKLTHVCWIWQKCFILTDKLAHIYFVTLSCFISLAFQTAEYRLLTYWGRDKMADNFQTTFSNAFSWMKMYEFQLRFHWNLFLRFQLTIFQHWFR